MIPLQVELFYNYVLIFCDGVAIIFTDICTLGMEVIIENPY